ncbi:translation initiation factor IF-2-like [Cebus imitator]|uniref:translation initiation factor IF-2-like n=1 Tax=Cebus imitator TaxID=2715852 RepID=UPI00189A5294|nr:translation initiation factor IF-2-like [Cebus imitator]
MWGNTRRASYEARKLQGTRGGQPGARQSRQRGFSSASLKAPPARPVERRAHARAALRGAPSLAPGCAPPLSTCAPPAWRRAARPGACHAYVCERVRSGHWGAASGGGRGLLRPARARDWRKQGHRAPPRGLAVTPPPPGRPSARALHAGSPPGPRAGVRPTAQSRRPGWEGGARRHSARAAPPQSAELAVAKL